MERAEVGVAVAEVPESSVQASTQASVLPPADPAIAASVESVAIQSVESPVDLVAIEEAIEDPQFIEDAPTLALNIEQEVSLSAPPDLNSPECPSCWKALRATDKFCCWCGEAQPNRVLPFLKLCLECSTFLPEKANYCYSCGTDVGYSSRRKVRMPHELFKDEESEFFPRFDA
ncbi:MAG: zinc ribbon domain-containing protein [Candidatus Melainabacteria bacterium]|nr:zinc ribbon domain-containing protein [Candidatus Melainabacteria bacterium]